MNIRWLPEAADDLQEIYDYLHARSPEAAHRVVNDLYQGIRTLSRTPLLGRLRVDQRTRELNFPGIRYKVTYRIHQQVIEVLYIRHTSRDPRIH